MSRTGPGVTALGDLGLAALGSLAAVSALGFLYRALLPYEAAATAAFGVAGAWGLRRAWSHLPRFVGAWLDAGVVLTVTLVAVLATVANHGVALLVLRWPEVVALGLLATVLGTAVASLAYTHHRLAADVAAQADRVAAMRRSALQSRLIALSAQINPHFLFNTLNTLAELVHEDEDRAEDMITDLAAMMRYALRSSASRVTLAEELAVVRRLLRIEAERLQDRLIWSVEADDGALDAEIPGLLVQPLVENAVKHGVASRPEGGTVTVRAIREDDRVVVVVHDDGPGLPDEVAGALEASGRGTEGGRRWPGELR